MICEVCNKREVTDYVKMNDNPFVIPFNHTNLEDGRIRTNNKNIRNMCNNCYDKIEKTMRKLMGL